MSIEDIKLVAEVIQALLNPNNEIRKQASAKLDELRKNVPGLLYCLINILKSWEDNKIKQMAAVLMRKLLEIKDYQLVNPEWAKMQPEQKEQMKIFLLEIILNEKDKKIRKNTIDLINQVAENVFESENEKWDELINLVLKFLSLELNEENLQLIEIGLILLSGIFNFVYDEIISKVDGLIVVFRNFFKTNSLSLKVRTSRTVAEMITYCDKKETKLLSEFIFEILLVTLKCFEEGHQEDDLKYSIKAISEIINSEPSLLVKHFSDLYTLMFKVFQKKDYLDENIRELGFEVVVSIVERKNKLFLNDTTKVKAFIEELYKYALEMEKEVTEDWATPAQASYYDEDFIYEEKVSSAFSYIDRLVETLDYKFLLPLLSEIVLQLLQNDNDWRFKYIALLSISQIICYVDDMTLIENIIPTIFDHVNHPNPKVRYAAVNCINEMSESFSPHFESNYHEKIIPIIMERTHDQVLRVQLESFEALSTFIDKSDSNIASLYAQVVLDSVFGLFLKDIPVSLREEILEVIAELLSTLTEKFKPYAENSLKILIEYFVTIYNTKQNKSLYGNLIECITLIGPYAEDVYYTFIPQLVQIIVEIQNNIPLSTDPIRNYLQEALERLIPIMKIRFNNILPNIVESVIKLVKLVPEMSVSNSPEEQFKIEDLLKSDDAEVCFESNKTSVKTSSTEDMKSIIELLNTTIEALQDLFLPFFETTHAEIFPLLKYYVNEDVRIEASNTLPILMKIVSQYAKENSVTIAKLYISQLVEAIKKEFDNLTLSVFFDNLGEIIDNAGSLFLTKDELNNLFSEIMNIFTDVESRRIKLINKKENIKKNTSHKKVQHTEEEDDDDDENLENEIENDIEEIEQIQSSLADTIGFMFKSHKDISGDIVSKIISEMLPKFFAQSATHFEIKMGIFIVDDMIEYLGQDYLSNIWNDMARAVITYCDSTDCSIRQAAVYGIGVFAQHTKDFTNYAEDCLKGLHRALAIPAGDDEDSWGLARDNAVASLGKIIKCQGQSIDLQGCVDEWIKRLPLTYDLGETEEQHNMLCDIVVSRPDISLGSCYEKLPSVIRILARIYKTKYSSAEINVKIENIMGAISSKPETLSIMRDTKEKSEDKIRKKIGKFLDN